MMPMASSLNVVVCWCWLLLVIFPYSYANTIKPVLRNKHPNHPKQPKHPKHPKHPKPAIFGPGPWKNAHATFYGGGDGTESMGTCVYEYFSRKQLVILSCNA